MSGAATASASRARGRWLALGEASRILGVDVTTLRRWADNGAIQTFRTPGGHRRFTDADLTRFVRRRHSATARPSEVFGRGGERLLSASSGRRVRTQPWFRAIPGPQADAIGYSCRRMMAALAEYLAGTGTGVPARRKGESAARALGAEVAALGLSPAQATEAFLFFRQAIARSVSSRLPLRADRKLQSIRRVEDYFNRVQLVLMDAYARGSQPRRRPGK